MSAGSDTIQLWQGQLQVGLAEMAVALNQLQQDQLLGYLNLLLKWNRAFNLTAVREPREMVSRQLLDSLSILDLIRGPSLLDVGTGPGLPGIPLAVARPDMNFSLLDSNGKKTRFLRQVKMQLDLQNVRVVRSRLEAYTPEERFRTVTSRAFSSLLEFNALCSRLVAENGRLLAMKGSVPGEEIEQLRRQQVYASVVALRVPGSAAERHAIVLEA